ncbi:MAG: glutathione peroxidase [Saprospiraceae bacterium]
MFVKTTFSVLLISSALFFPACFGTTKVPPGAAATTVAPKSAGTFFQFTVKELDGTPVRLEQFRGKKIVVLNVASKCGYTPQYADWETFFSENESKAVVLAFPCNDFREQEPGSAEEIAAFCESNYHITFPIFEKVHVKGADKAPIYRWLTDPAQNGWNSQEPTWNFCKYLINEKGELTHFFPPKVKPDSPEFLAAFGSK